MMADNSSERIGLTPLDHIPAKVFLPYILYFDTNDPETALRTIQNGIDKLVSQLPWIAGDVVIRSESPQTQNRAYIVPPPTAAEAGKVSLLHIKRFEHDVDFRTHPVQSYLAIPCFVPASEQRPVVRFQANVFPSKIVLVMSFMHMVFDGSGAGIILEALAECCRNAANSTADMKITRTIATSDRNLREQVSAWPSKCQTRLDHSQELGLPTFDSNISAEQWGAMESAVLSTIETRKIVFSPEKLAKVKEEISASLPPQLEKSSYVSSNDIITAVLGICVDRVLHPERVNETESAASIFMVVDLRSRVQPPLPDTYLGNIIYPMWDCIHSGEPTEAQTGEAEDLIHLKDLALRLRTRLSTIDETVAHSVAATVVQSGDWSQVEGRPADVFVTSWRHLKVFTLDFGPGLGHVEDFKSGLNLVPGACIVMPARTQVEDENGGSQAPWEVSITMKLGGFEALLKDPLFSQIVA